MCVFAASCVASELGSAEICDSTRCAQRQNLPMDLVDPSLAWLLGFSMDLGHHFTYFPYLFGPRNPGKSPQACSDQEVQAILHRLLLNCRSCC